MMQVLVLALLSCALALSTGAAPQLAETFTSSVRVIIYEGRSEYTGVGAWAVIQPKGMAVENIKFDNGTYDVFNLQRYDLGEQYTLDPTDTKKCREFKVSGDMPAVWSWLDQAKFIGKAGVANESVDIWEARVGYAVLRIGVKTTDPTTPVYMVRESRDERKTVYEFLTWSADVPPSTYFNVPSACSSNTTEAQKKQLACISRSDIISRAEVWVKDHVPYNQGGHFQGYREDCSGYVSMAWDSSKPGHVTQTIHEIAKPTSKDDLQPGDCLLYAAEHVVLFGGWADSSKTHYIGYEETNPSTGTQKETIPYPYWYSPSDFLPYRYDNVCS